MIASPHPRARLGSVGGCKQPVCAGPGPIVSGSYRAISGLRVRSCRTMAESSNVHGRRGSVTRVVPPAGRRTQAWLDLATKGAPVAGPGGRAEGIFTGD